MKPNVPSTVIKLPIDVTESNAGARIRLRNNIRLNLPPDTFSLLQSRSLCLLLLFYLSYSLYLHYILYVHIAAQDVTNRRMSAEIDKLNQRPDAIRISDLEQRSVDDLKQSLRRFINTFKHKYYEEVADNEDDEELYSSYYLRLSSREDHKDMFTDIDSNEIAIHLLESYADMKPNNTHQAFPSDLNTNDTKYQVSGVSNSNNVSKASVNRAIRPDHREVVIVLPKSKVVVDSKHRKVRDVVSNATEQPSQAKGKKNRKKHKVPTSVEKANTTRRQENKRRCGGGCRKCVSILLKGAAPTASIRDGGVIRPWYLDARANGNSNSDVSEHFVLQELNGKVQIMKSGLYMVYAQIYYTSSEHLTNISESINSYSVTVAATSGTERALAVCSVHASVNLTSEVSCHLSIVYHLNRGERVYLVQREPNRKILLKDGYSYFGLSTLRLDATRM